MESGNGDTVSVGDNIRRLAKKVRRRPEEPLDLDDPVVNDKRMKLDSINVRTVSWKYKLLNTTIERINLQNEEDIEKALDNFWSISHHTVVDASVLNGLRFSQ
ncbi:hypothetical protein Goshw_026583 [Gossypium schwendimanii]|uniref:Uncharacterized protein n=1 Tax=Gossypium schwendimanii TaxID=34291 RepID=A0A7J9MEB8_GOSSC|nr:hypothetical protein [Gossypium schwendimanii]